MESSVGDTAIPVALFTLLLMVIWMFYRQFTQYYDFWDRQGVPNKRPVFPFGSLKDLVLLRKPVQEVYNQVYCQFPDERFCGVVDFNQPVLVIRDPDLIKDILIKNFNSFVDRVPLHRNPKEWLLNHLFLMEGESWRSMRLRLIPAFSSGKMKNMFPMMIKCSEQMENYITTIIETQSSVNVKEVLAKFTMDVIATCAFGLEINCSVAEETDFYKLGISILKPGKRQILHHLLYSLFPRIANLLSLEYFPPHLKVIIYTIIKDTVQFREENNICRNDFIDILIKLKKCQSILDSSEDAHETLQLASYNSQQSSKGKSNFAANDSSGIFFLAGFETSSSVMTFCLYELAQHQDVQDRLLRELQHVLEKHDNQLTYQALQEMKYLDQVINETLRMYGSLGVLHRRCTQAYQVPGSDLVLQPGQLVFIPSYAVHHDPQFYPEPFTFDPERFTPENMAGRHSCTFIPFGTGPRNCIGMRFGLMQTKVGLTTMVTKFKFEVAADTTIPIPLQTHGIVTQPSRPVYLKITPRSLK